MNNSIKIAYMCIIISVCFLGCHQKKEIQENTWPPLGKTEIPNFSADSKLIVNNIDKASNITFLVVNHCKLIMTYNLFNIPLPDTSLMINNQIEVVYFDENQTYINVDSTKNDKMYLIQIRPGKLSETMMYTGTKVRYEDITYEIRKDGWYVNNELRHAF